MSRILATTAMSMLICSTLVGGAGAAGLVSGEGTGPATIGSPYVEIYGGVSLGGTSSWEGSDYDMDSGAAFGAAFGLTTPVQGLAFELDVMKSGGGYTGYNSGLDVVSVMINGEYSIPLGDTFELYGAAGIGLIHLTYDAPSYAHESGSGAGYQLAAGVRALVTEDISVFGEVRHQNSFGEISAGNFEIQYPTLNVLAGLHFAF